MEHIKLGDRVKIPSKNSKGEVAFIGHTNFSDGIFFGIILDEAKGKHNGTVNGHRYFKCPKNHGVFVRACQIQRECTDDNNTNDKLDNCASRRIVYPNYLRSKTKGEKYKYSSKSTGTCESTTKIKNLEQQNQIHGEDLKADSKSSELEIVKKENAQLKKKIKAAEESVQEYLSKYNKAAEEIKNLKEDLDYKNKQLKIHKWHIKFLKLRQCNKFQESDPLNPSNKKFIQNKDDDYIDLFNTDFNLSDDEFDLENMKHLTSMQRIVELEQENRRLVQGILKLNDFLNSKLLSQFVELDSSKVKEQSYLQEANTFPDYSDSFGRLKSDNFSELFFSSQQENCTEMLREMTKFNEVVKKKDKTVSSSVARNLNTDGQEDFTLMQKQCLPDNVYSNLAVDFPNFSISRTDSKDWTKANTQMNCESRSSFTYDTVDFDDSFQAKNKSFQQFYLLENKGKKKSHLQNLSIGDVMPSNVSLSNPVEQARNLMTAITPSSDKIQCLSNMSLIQQTDLVEKNYDNSSNLIPKKSESGSKSHMILPNQMLTASKSRGDNELILPEDNESRKKMFISSNINVRKDSGNVV